MDLTAFVGVQRGLVRLLDERGGLVLVAQRGLDRDFLVALQRINLTEMTASARAALNKRPFFVQDIYTDANYAPYLHLIEHASIRAVLAIPLVTHSGVCVGVMSAYFSEPKRPNAVEERMLETYGKIAADRVVAMIGPGPISLTAKRLFDKALEQTPTTRKLLPAVTKAVRRLLSMHH